MSTTAHPRKEPRPRRRPQIAIPFNFRENLPFKLLALLLAAFLYFFVQSERNPTIARTLGAQITRENQPQDVAVEMDQQRFMVNITGPRALVERLKEEDIRAIADLKAVRASEPSTAIVRLTYSILGQPPHPLLTLDPPNPYLKLRVYPPKTRSMPVSAQFPQEPAAGHEYGRVAVTPRTLSFTGRADKVNRVARLVANAQPPQTGGRIDGKFPVVAYDSEGNPVEDVKLDQDTVEVTVPLLPKPPVKIVLVSPEIVDIPLPPYKIESISVTPRQVRVVGRPERLNQIATISTAPISAQNFTAPEELSVRLMVPPDVTVRDMNNRPVSQAQVRVNIQKMETAPPPAAPPSRARPTPEETREKPPTNTP